MWRDDDACLARPATDASAVHPVWLALGPDRALLDAQALSLARFGVIAQPGYLATPPPAATPVLCDGRSRHLVRPLLDHKPPRVAPLIVFGINSAQERARMILAGADDAVSARTVPSELAARMIAAHRAHAAALGIIRLAGFTFDTGLRQVRWRSAALPLMPREFDLLLVLARHAGMPVSRDVLLQSVWQTSFDPGTNSPEVHVFKLRRRLAVLGGTVRIDTVKRQGYRLAVDLS